MVAIAYGAFVYTLWVARDRDISRFVVAGGSGFDPAEVPPGLTVLPNGYDGGAFYRLALDPFTTERKAFGITLDNPAYRQQRIGYPLIVWVLSFGEPTLVPALLVAVNFAALVTIAIAGVLIASRLGLAPLWGVTFAFYPGFLMSLSRDTSEIVAAAFLLAGLAALLARRPWLATALLTYAVLTRETTLLAVVAIGVAWLIARLRRTMRWPSFVFLIPGAVYVLWQAVLTWQWGEVPARAGAPGMAIPLSEYFRFFAAAAPRRIQLQRLYFNECLYLAIITVLAAVASLRRRGAPLEWRLGWLAYFVLAALMPAVMWQEDFGFLRIFSELFVFSTLVVLPARTWMPAICAAATAGLWYHLSAHIVNLR